ncbi:DUF4783 domain-containing protein [Phaeodactylibacter luteus]|uniref:DUF4783 domain-containing protein n=1 Tax=Phaeodactylibacter luteus TaxID=1564516 RepID=A0A5C6RHH1_9BACT|nr:DUF4783 domain-containing protein [Phaeodactylibacter luteus]TXB61781.1 DUF4783 domain-containing protein [Phaeodactylibacter luteus]
MKSLLLVAFLLPVAPQLGDADLGAITRAISKGDAAALGAFFDDSVEVSILSKDEIYPKAKAEAVVAGFFQKYPPASFSTVHKGTAPNKNSEYCIGNLLAGGKTFRVYIYMKAVGDKQLIQELRFDEE